RDRRQDTRLTIGIDVGVLQDPDAATEPPVGSSSLRPAGTEDYPHPVTASPPASDPRLAVPLRIDRDKAPRLHELLQQVSQQRAGPPLYADYFLCRPRELDLGSRWEGTLGELLEVVDRQADTAWILDAAGLRLRSRSWATDEAREPPAAVM